MNKTILGYVVCIYATIMQENYYLWHP